jgi:hypothetical protein
VVSRDPRWRFDDDTLGHALGRMRDARIRCLPVLDSRHRRPGKLELGDVVMKAVVVEALGKDLMNEAARCRRRLGEQARTRG